MHPPLGPVQGKRWGTTQSVFALNSVEVSRLLPISRGYCSEHYHANKFSRFYVLRGKLKIVIFGEDMIDETVLTTGMCTDVPPGVWHKFEAMEDSDAIEIYWVVLDDNDIKRRTKGGVSTA